jgi:hypothetical protein
MHSKNLKRDKKAQLMNDYVCTCSCGCKNSTGEYTCNDCMMNLCKIEIKEMVVA